MSQKHSDSHFDAQRRRFLKHSGLAVGAAVGAGAAAAGIGASAWASPMVTRPRVELPFGVQSGDVTPGGAVIWSRADRPARMFVELADNPEFMGARRLQGPAALPSSDLTAKLAVQDLAPGRRNYYRVTFRDLEGAAHDSEPVTGSLMVPPAGDDQRGRGRGRGRDDEHRGGRARGRDRDVRFVWGGDVAGQGWGINPDFGGMRIFETMRQVHPDFFIQSGDSVYADGPLQEQVILADGGIWRNIVTDAKAKVAETLDEFRGQFRYNLLDENLRRFNAEVPMYAQWDDHEVVNNWFPGEILTDPRYTVTSVDLLAARAQRAFVDYMPVRFGDRARLFNAFSYGPSLEVFRIDLRSFRGPNTTNDQPEPGPDTDFFGAEQLRFLRQALKRSRATWKVIASDMPIGLVVRDGSNFENGANADDGAPLGRELELARLLRFIRDEDIRNVVWLTADVHYTAAHYYDPSRAGFRHFAPFWEFVSGPLNAGTFGPNDLDATFGPQVVFQKAPPAGQANLPPSAGLQFFGQVDVEGVSDVMTVTLKDLDGVALFSQTLMPE